MMNYSGCMPHVDTVVTEYITPTVPTYTTFPSVLVMPPVQPMYMNSGLCSRVGSMYSPPMVVEEVVTTTMPTYSRNWLW